MRKPTRITILGFDGSGQAPSMEEIAERARPVWREQFPTATREDLDTQGHPARSGWTDTVRDHLFAWFCAQSHNELVDLLTRLADLDELYPRAVAHADALYADLDKNTTINWLAAHHRFVNATRTARALLAEHAELTETLAARRPNILCGAGSELSAAIYQRYVPEAERLVMPSQDHTDSAKLGLASFIETSIERFQILRATITGSFPPGFAPAPTDVTAEWAGDSIPISPALAYAGEAMRIPGPRPGDPETHARNW